MVKYRFCWVKMVENLVVFWKNTSVFWILNQEKTNVIQRPSQNFYLHCYEH